jgi:hypothetical protein
MAEEGRNLDCAAVARMVHAAEMHEPERPVDIGFLGPESIALPANDVPHLIQQARLGSAGKTWLLCDGRSGIHERWSLECVGTLNVSDCNNIQAFDALQGVV